MEWYVCRSSTDHFLNGSTVATASALMSSSHTMSDRVFKTDVPAGHGVVVVRVVTVDTVVVIVTVDTVDTVDSVVEVDESSHRHSGHPLPSGDMMAEK